jgi:hypothetical protein
MNSFLQRLFNTEFLPTSEVRKIKVSVVMVFLLVISVATVPFSFVFNYSMGFKIGVISSLFLFYALNVVFVRLGKFKTAMQMSIIYMLAISLFYTQGTSSFYAYLFFYISLTVVVFYQELYLYLFYGTITVVFGILYVLIHQSEFVLLGGSNLSIYLFTVILGLFYVVFLIQILHSEKLYTDLNYDWVKMNQIIEKHQEQSLFYLDELRKTAKDGLLHEDLSFQKAADEIAVFVGEQCRENGKDITNVLDLYLYIHERGLNHILENDDFSVAMKKIANRLDKYLMSHRTDMTSMVLNFSTKFQPTEPYKEGRYEYRLEALCPTLEDQIIALALLYSYLANEVTALDKYDQMTKKLTKTEIAQLFESEECAEFFSAELIAFFKDNQDLFEATLIGPTGKD